MIAKKQKNIEDFYDVSIVMSFYRKLNDFKRVLPKNVPFFQRNGIEVILVMDEASEEKEVLHLISEYPSINWKVIINRKEHEWRNHCKVLNVGIRQASFEYILVMDPEVEMYTDVIYQLRYMLYYYPGAFAVGNVLFTDFLTESLSDKIAPQRLIPYGSIMGEKKAFCEVMGYEEHYTAWGAEDDNIRARFEMAGLQKIYVPDAITIHREDSPDGHSSRTSKSSGISISVIREALLPKSISGNTSAWGTDFDEVIYDWKTTRNRSVREKLLGGFEHYHLYEENPEARRLPVVCLIQVKNEQKHLPEVLTHLDKYCDGIILLDDGSEDDSFERAVSDKLLLKVKKKNAEIFDDLQNRNILLKLGSLFLCDWFLFMDADERFDPRYADLNKFIDKTDIDTLSFRLVHVWNDPLAYRKDIPEGKDGVMRRYRMFRSKGALQINAERTLHFRATPYKRNLKNADILVLHYGLMDREARQRKYKEYLLLDSKGEKQGYPYEYLIQDKIASAPLEEL